MSTPASARSSTFSVYMEPYVYTSAETKFGQTGYQLLIRGNSLLDPSSNDYTALITLLKQAGQIPIAEDADPTLIYAPLGHGRGVFISISWIKDWRGRPGAAASALVFKHSDIAATTAVELGEYLRNNPRLFIDHNRAVRMVDANDASKSCPIAQHGVTLQIPTGQDPTPGADELPFVLASAENLRSDQQRWGSSADDVHFQLLRSLLWLTPVDGRVNTSFVWNAAGDLPLPMPTVLLWRPGVTSRVDLPSFPSKKGPSSPQARALLKLFGTAPERLAGMANQVIRRGGGREVSPTDFWQEITDQFNIEQVLDGENYLDTAIAPERVAQALDALQRSDTELFDRWVADNGARLFTRRERFLAVMAAFFFQREAYKSTLTRLRQQFPASLVSLLQTHGLEATMAPYAADARLVEPLLLAAFEIWIETKPSPPASWGFLGRLDDRNAWGRAIAKQPLWLRPALETAEFRAIAESLIAEVAAEPEKRDRVSRHFWNAARETGDEQVLAWAFSQTPIVVGLGVKELESMPDALRRSLSARIREAGAKGMALAPETCWAMLRSPCSDAELRQTLRDSLLLQSREGERYSDDNLAEFIRSLARDVPTGIDEAKKQRVRKDLEEIIRLNCDQFSDLHTFEHRFLGMRVTQELERFNCDVGMLASYFGLAARKGADLTSNPRVPGQTAAAGSVRPAAGQREAWFRRHLSVLVGIGGTLLVFLVGGLVWHFLLSPEASAVRQSEALQEMRQK